MSNRFAYKKIVSKTILHLREIKKENFKNGFIFLKRNKFKPVDKNNNIIIVLISIVLDCLELFKLGFRT